MMENQMIMQAVQIGFNAMTGLLVKRDREERIKISTMAVEINNLKETAGERDENIKVALRDLNGKVDRLVEHMINGSGR